MIPFDTRHSSIYISIFTENEEDALHNQVDQDSSTILNECKRDASRRSLAQKMTTNLRRLSGATELKIDMNDPIAANNPKYCNKKIKVSKLMGLNTIEMQKEKNQIEAENRNHTLLKWKRAFIRNFLQKYHSKKTNESVKHGLRYQYVDLVSYRTHCNQLYSHK